MGRLVSRGRLWKEGRGTAQGTLEILPQEAQLGPRSEAPEQKSQKPPPAGSPWGIRGLCLWARGMTGTAGHPAFSLSPHQEGSPKPGLYLASAPPAQPLTWAWGCWFLGRAGRLWGSPRISIQYLLFQTCRDIAPRGGAGASQGGQTSVPISHRLCRAVAGVLTGTSPGALYP